MRESLIPGTCPSATPFCAHYDGRRAGIIGRGGGSFPGVFRSERPTWRHFRLLPYKPLRKRLLTRSAPPTQFMSVRVREHTQSPLDSC